MSEDTGQRQPRARARRKRGGSRAAPGAGARSRLSDAFLKELLADFEAHGAAAIVKMREDKAGDYVKLVAAHLPREVSGAVGEPIAITEIRRTIVASGH